MAIEGAAIPLAIAIASFMQDYTALMIACMLYMNQRKSQQTDSVSNNIDFTKSANYLKNRISRRQGQYLNLCGFMGMNST